MIAPVPGAKANIQCMRSPEFPDYMLRPGVPIRKGRCRTTTHDCKTRRDHDPSAKLWRRYRATPAPSPENEGNELSGYFADTIEARIIQ